MTSNTLHIHPDELEKIQFEPTSYCNLRCPACSRTDETTLLPKKDVVNFQQHIPLSLIKPIFSNLPKLNNVKMDGDIGDALMHPQLDKICKLIIKMHPKIEIRIHTNGTPGKDSMFENLLRMKNVYFVLGIDGLEDTNHIHRVGASWKIIKKRLELVRDISPNKHEWRWIDFDYNRHQFEEARKMARDYKIYRIEVAKPYEWSNEFLNIIKKEKETSIRNKKGWRLDKNGIPIERKTEYSNPVPFYKDKDLEIVRKEHESIISQSKDEWKVCPWKNSNQLQVMSNGQVWPCCWSSQMQINSTKYTPKQIMQPYLLSEFDKELQYTMNDWYNKVGADWVKNITVREDFTLRDVLLGKGYRELGLLLQPRKQNYSLSYCSKTCGNFTQSQKALFKETDLSLNIGEPAITSYILSK